MIEFKEGDLFKLSYGTKDSSRAMYGSVFMVAAPPRDGVVALIELQNNEFVFNLSIDWLLKTYGIEMLERTEDD